MQHHKGFSLLEVVITLALSSVIFAALASSFGATARSHHHFDEALLARRVENLLTAELSKFTRDYDSHPLRLPPIIHEPGSIRLHDGSPNPVMRAATLNIRPDRNSQAVSFIVPEWGYAMRRAPQQSLAGSLAACSRSSGRIELSEIRSIIAVGADGMWQASLTAAEPTGAVGCYRLTLTPTQGIFLPALPREELPLVRLLIPIAEEYTLYLSSRGELRYLGHRGAENLENQPIISGLDGFGATILPEPLPGIFAISLHTTIHQRLVRQAALHHFPKVSYVELLLNAL